MSNKVTEMNLPVISLPPMSLGAVETDPSVPYPAMDDTSMAVGSPMSTHDPKNITVYAQSINPCSYSQTDLSVVAFDVVFSVGILCEDGTTRTYQVVKRIGLDKVKLACDAEASTPVSIVESKSAALKEEAAATTKRFRRLAGLE